jgi:hypothetical protein
MQKKIRSEMSYSDKVLYNSLKNRLDAAEMAGRISAVEADRLYHLLLEGWPPEADNSPVQREARRRAAEEFGKARI